jgi:hypothetical protein
LLLAAVAGCSRPKQLSPEQVRSALRKSVSLVSESELIASRIRERRVNAAYAAAHAEYLRQEIDQTVKQLSGAPSQPQLQPVVDECTRQLRTLTAQLETLHTVGNDSAAAAASEERLAAIAATLRRLEAVP